MGAQDKKWIIRDSAGHIYGPFTLPKLKELLGKGIIIGEEQIAEYPAGDWSPLSSVAEIYDTVIEALAQPQSTRRAHPKVQPEMQKTSSQKTPGDTLKITGTESGSTKTKPLNDPQNSSHKSAPRAEIKSRKLDPSSADAGNIDDPFFIPQGNTQGSSQGSAQGHAQTGSYRQDNFGGAPGGQDFGSPPPGDNSNNVLPLFKNQKGPKDIELEQKDRLKRRSGNLIPLIFLLLAGLLFYIALTSNKKKAHRNQTISLLMPQQRKVQDPAKSQELVTQGWGYFYKDTFTNYLRAEELFVSAVEQSPMNADALVMLLLTDQQLWPYSKQDGSDQNTLQNLLQMLSKADPYGARRGMGSATVDLILGRDASAMSQINSALISQPTEGRLYALRAKLLFDSGDFSQSVAYFDKAATLMPHWSNPSFMLGFSYERMGNPTAAYQYFSRALQINPKHEPSRLEIGILEHRYFGHDDKAREFINVALESDERFLPLSESRARLTLAEIFYKSGDRAAAKKEAEKAVKLNPSDPDLRDLLARLGSAVNDQNGALEIGSDRQHMSLGDQYMRSNNFLGAQAQYKAAFVANPKNARAAMKAAEALWKLHQAADSIDYLQRAVSADTKFTEGYVLLADYKSQRYDFEGATRALESAIRANPKHYEIYREYAEMSLRRADLASAELYANRALQLYETDVKSNEIMSRVQLLKKDIIKAVEYAKRAIELDKSDVEAQVNYAKVKATYEGIKESADYLKELIDTYPTQLAYRVGLADILIQDEQYSAARQILQQVVNADEMNKDAYMLLGEASFLSGNLDEALNSFLAAARVDPSDPSALFRSGEIYLRAGKYSEAQKQFQLVLRVNSLFPRTHYDLARAFYGLGLGDLALKELDEEKRLNPKLADPYEFAGDINLASRKFQNATREYQKASEIKPQNAGIYVKLARAYRGSGSLDAALAMLRLAAAKESGYAEIYREYGMVYEAKGLADQAATSFEEYLKLEPNASDRDDIQKRIKELQ